MADRYDWVPQALREPAAVAGWPSARRSLLVRQARAAGLLGRLAPAFATGDQPEQLQARAHVSAAMRVTEAQRREIRREAAFIARALAPLGVPVVLLKGAAYVVADLPPAAGRVFSDIDILLPRSHLKDAESLLMLAGWMVTPQSPYDQRFYREWMHELPPMEHVHRRTTLDVHHTIAPLTGRLKPQASALLQDAVPVPGIDGIRVLAPADMVLHSITHLFSNDELSHGLRDLSDIDQLLRHFSADLQFWATLVARAELHGLSRLLHHAVTHVTRTFDTPVPHAVVEALQHRAPAPPLDSLMRWLWTRALCSPHPTAQARSRPLAMAGLYLRGHWLRMPLPMLIRHLSIKALRLHERGLPPSQTPAP